MCFALTPYMLSRYGAIFTTVFEVDSLPPIVASDYMDRMAKRTIMLPLYLLLFSKEYQLWCQESSYPVTWVLYSEIYCLAYISLTT
jgi:hypothetical protein